MSKDQAIGGLICLVCVLLAIFYAVALFFPSWLSVIGINGLDDTIRLWVIGIPVLITFVAIMAIGAWIGWTMATTPPPKPIEEITAEMEEKKEEPKAEAPKPEEAAAETSVEEKKPEKKRKS
jgi:hypothetical protein